MREDNYPIIAFLVIIIFVFSLGGWMYVDGSLNITGIIYFAVIVLMMFMGIAFVVNENRSWRRHEKQYDYTINKLKGGPKRKMGIIEEVEEHWKGYAIVGILAYLFGNKKMREKIVKKTTELSESIVDKFPTKKKK